MNNTTKTKESKIKTVHSIQATMITVDCPHCGFMNEGFLGDPRGGRYDCDDCKEPFRISDNAEVILS